MLTKAQETQTSASARVALRLASDASHQRMHGLGPFARIAAKTLSLDDYRLLLQSLFRFHSAVGAAARKSSWSRVSSAQRRLDLLRSDLAFVGGAVPSRVSDWQPGVGEAVLGALYAAEGSMLGGRVIARQLDYAFGANQEGRRFFVGENADRETWSALMLVLEERCGETRALNAAISGACRTFDWFEHCVTCSYSADPSTFASRTPRSSRARLFG